MVRRIFLRGVSMIGAGGLLHTGVAFPATHPKQGKPGNDRAYWVDTLTRIARPVLEAMSQDKLKERMPVESAGEDRENVTYLEALGRTLAGLAPWLELGPDTTKEGQARAEFIRLAVASIKHAVTPTSTNYMNFTNGRQPLVDAAFLAHALLRAPQQLWGNLDSSTRENLVAALRSTRIIKPYNSNWLLFSAMVEAAILKFSNDHDPARIDHAIKQHETWYKGDGMYGDGPDFHFDYYNSFVIQPMLIDIVDTLHEKAGDRGEMKELLTRRAKRFAEIQERLISPEGTFPPVGRSIAYRCGAFQLLAQMALQKQLPEALPGAQVRSALTAVIMTTMDAPATFDKNGWLTIGLSGHQPGIGETYISTGSLYLCTVAFLPLGLPPTDEFWSAPAADWTAKKAYAGKAFPIDKAL